MAEQNPNARPDEQTPEQDALEKSLEELSLDELLASVKDDLARVDAMMDEPGDAAQPEQPDAPAPDTPDAAEEAPKPGMQPLFEPKIPEEYADLTVDQETQPESQEPEKKRPRLPSGIRVLLYVCCVLAVAVLLAVAVWRCADDVLSLTKEDAEVTVSIPDGATISQIAGELKSKGLVRYETLFKFYCWASHAEKTIEPGTYTLNSRYDYHALVSNMIEASPDRAVVEVTIPEGYECEDIFRLLEADGVCSYQDLADTAASYEFAYDFLQEIPYGSENRLEGYLFPDTYQFFENDTVESILDRFLNNFENKLTDEMRDDIAKSGYTTDQIITLASIIQAEAADTEDMYKISTVLHNRLESGAEHDIYTLDCDSTVYYPYKTANDAPEGFVSSYSTYDNNGLPAGPICNPGLEAIKAAIYPSTSDVCRNAYYFCHDSNGKAYYASTMDEHLMNMAEAGLL